MWFWKCSMITVLSCHQSCEKYPKVTLAKITNNTICLQLKKVDCRLTDFEREAWQCRKWSFIQLEMQVETLNVVIDKLVSCNGLPPHHLCDLSGVLFVPSDSEVIDKSKWLTSDPTLDRTDWTSLQRNAWKQFSIVNYSQPTVNLPRCVKTASYISRQQLRGRRWKMNSGKEWHDTGA